MTRQTAPRGRGRPPLEWIAGGDLTTNLRPGTALSIETVGRHAPRIVGRVAGWNDTHIELTTTGEPIDVPRRMIKRARILPGLYEPGDPVLRRGVHADRWRGGVVRTEGPDVLVEQIDGAFAWYPETDLEPAERRDPILPPLPRGPVPTRA